MNETVNLEDKVNIVEAARFVRDYAVLPQEVADKLHTCDGTNRNFYLAENTKLVMEYVLETIGAEPGCASAVVMGDNLSDIQITDPNDPHAKEISQMKAEYSSMKTQLKTARRQVLECKEKEAELISQRDSYKKLNNDRKEHGEHQSCLIDKMQAEIDQLRTNRPDGGEMTAGPDTAETASASELKEGVKLLREELEKKQGVVNGLQEAMSEQKVKITEQYNEITSLKMGAGHPAKPTPITVELPSEVFQQAEAETSAGQASTEISTIAMQKKLEAKERTVDTLYETVARQEASIVKLTSENESLEADNHNLNMIAAKDVRPIDRSATVKMWEGLVGKEKAKVLDEIIGVMETNGCVIDKSWLFTAELVEDFIEQLKNPKPDSEGMVMVPEYEHDLFVNIMAAIELQAYEEEHPAECCDLEAQQLGKWIHEMGYTICGACVIDDVKGMYKAYQRADGYGLLIDWTANVVELPPFDAEVFLSHSAKPGEHMLANRIKVDGHGEDGMWYSVERREFFELTEYTHWRLAGRTQAKEVLTVKIEADATDAAEKISDVLAATDKLITIAKDLKAGKLPVPEGIPVRSGDSKCSSRYPGVSKKGKGDGVYWLAQKNTKSVYWSQKSPHEELAAALYQEHVGNTKAAELLRKYHDALQAAAGKAVPGASKAARKCAVDPGCLHFENDKCHFQGECPAAKSSDAERVAKATEAQPAKPVGFKSQYPGVTGQKQSDGTVRWMAHQPANDDRIYWSEMCESEELAAAAYQDRVGNDKAATALREKHKTTKALKKATAKLSKAEEVEQGQAAAKARQDDPGADVYDNMGSKLM